MKTAILLTLISLVACTNHSYSQTMDVSRDSRIEWTGRPLVGTGHHGTIKIVSGFISLSDSELDKFDKGKIIIDMNSIQNTDMPEADGGADLVSHLKSDDFFAVAKYPQAIFEITSMTPLFPFINIQKYNVTGNLTIKGVTRVITFPATLKDTDKGLQFDGTLTIDRTKWNINYKSKSLISTVKDGIIEDEISISFKILFAGC